MTFYYKLFGIYSHSILSFSIKIDKLFVNQGDQKDWDHLKVNYLKEELNKVKSLRPFIFKNI